MGPNTRSLLPNRGASAHSRSGHRRRVPQIISRLYSASALYPGEDGNTFEQLLDELAIALGPADVIEWLLVADLRSVIFDERRYRCALALFLSPGKLIEPELSEMAVR